jgi:hypothetical protein
MTQPRRKPKITSSVKVTKAMMIEYARILFDLHDAVYGVVGKVATPKSRRVRAAIIALIKKSGRKA